MNFLSAQATDVDLSLKRGGGGKKPSDFEHGFVTIRDIQKQIATAFATPFDDGGPSLSAANAEEMATRWSTRSMDQG